MGLESLNLTAPLYDYMVSVSLRENVVLTQLREYNRSHLKEYMKMQISPEQGQFIAFLVKLIGARRCLEVGVFTGYSSTNIALAMPEDGQIVACDVNKEWTDVAQQFWRKAGVANKIDLRLAPALETLESLIDEGQANLYDFAFIDADKQNYCDYFDQVYTLLRPGGLVMIDNVLWGGRVADPANQESSTQAIRRFNQKLYSDDRVDISLVPIGDGLTLARKK